MAQSKLSDLLPIDGSVAKPNAYQVFGLRGGGHDDATVGQAMKRVYARLKQTKPTADPVIWKQAAHLAESARKVLEDPHKRSQLDQTLASFPSSDPSSSATQPNVMATADDPLAGLLPPSNPLAGVKPVSPTTRKAAAVLGVPPGVSPAASVLGTPPAPVAKRADHPVATTTSMPIGSADRNDDSVPLNWSPPKSKRAKRRKKNTGVLLFGGFVVVMLGGIVGLLHYLKQGGRIAINPSPQQGVMVAPPRQPSATPTRNSQPRSDAVLSAAPNSGVSDALPRPSRGTRGGSGLANADPLNKPSASMQPPPGSMQPAPGMSGPETPQPPEPGPPKPEPAPPDPEMAGMTSNDPSMSETTMEPDPQRVAANQSKLEAAEQLIQSAQWDRMKPAASEVLQLQLTPAQSKRASSLYDIADLAIYYRGAIERGLASLKTGNEFQYVDDIKMIVVEATPRTVTLRYNRKDMTFAIDELPPRLTESLAALTLSPDKPDAIAAQALYRLVHPSTNDEYRKDAFETLASVDGRLDQVDTAMLQTVAKELLSK